MTRNTGRAQCAHTADPCNKAVTDIIGIRNADTHATPGRPMLRGFSGRKVAGYPLRD